MVLLVGWSFKIFVLAVLDMQTPLALNQLSKSLLSPISMEPHPCTVQSSEIHNGAIMPS